MICWNNGVLYDEITVRIAPADRGFTLGDGVFETLPVRRGAALQVGRHLARLRDGAACLGIPVPYDDAVLDAAFGATVAANAIEDGSLRLTLTRGPASRGIATSFDATPTVLITAAISTGAPGPVSLIVAKSTRRNEFSPLSRIKSLNYLDSILARREAEQAGAEDALLLNTSGWVAEATTANVIVRLDGALLTPPVEHGALPGIARALLIEQGRLVSAAVSPKSLYRADALWLCNSLTVRPVRSLNDRPLGAVALEDAMAAGHR